MRENLGTFRQGWYHVWWEHREDKSWASRMKHNKTWPKVARKHTRIHALRRQGLYLKEIALAVGLKNHTTIVHHLQNKCRCVRRDRMEAGW